MSLLEMKEMSRRKFIQSFTAAAAIGAVFPLLSASAQAATPLSPVEIADLLWSREEEKVARDVYITLYNTWRHKTFDYISKSEQQHMDTMLFKLTTYGIPDPALVPIGAFTNKDLQNLYNDLVAKGSKSLIEALTVGCIIEEVDIIDLMKAIDHSTHKDLDTSYQNLMAGSYNHLRSFVIALKMQNVNYTPQYLDKDLYNSIING